MINDYTEEKMVTIARYMGEDIGEGGLMGVPSAYSRKAYMEREEIIAKQGHKDDGGKPRMALFSSVAMEKISEVLTFGAEKYDKYNWRKGMEWTRVASAALRHIFAWLKGEDKDPETGMSHLAHAGCCIMFLLDYEETRREFDDRYGTEGISGNGHSRAKRETSPAENAMPELFTQT